MNFQPTSQNPDHSRVARCQQRPGRV